MRNNREIGQWGEETALAYLLKKGYTLRSRNYRTQFGEIDLILSDEAYVIFVEVKTRKSIRYGMPCEAVSWKKQQRLWKTAQQWLQAFPTQLQPRFDVVEVYLYQSQVQHLQNAFDGRFV